ncbi:hypothetical protein [Microcoleus vaginatus]
MKGIWSLCLVLAVLLWGGVARAGVLGDRISLEFRLKNERI